MAESKLWLVVIDNTDNPEVNALRPPSLHNFYVVSAPDELTAKGFVWRTFGNNRRLIQQIADCTFATPLDYITGTLVDSSGNYQTGKFWSYVPIGGKRAPGQRRIKPKRESVLAPNEYGEMSAQAYQHIPPEVPEVTSQLTEQELREAQREVGGSRSPASPQTPQAPSGADPQQMMAQLLQQQQKQMEQLMAMMGQGNQAPPQAEKPLSEAELAKQAEQMQGSTKANELPPEMLRQIDASKTDFGNVEVSPEEDKDLQEAIKAQREKGEIPKTGTLDDFDENDLPDDLEDMAKRIKED